MVTKYSAFFQHLFRLHTSGVQINNNINCVLFLGTPLSCGCIKVGSHCNQLLKNLLKCLKQPPPSYRTNNIILPQQSFILLDDILDNLEETKISAVDEDAVSESTLKKELVTDDYGIASLLGLPPEPIWILYIQERSQTSDTCCPCTGLPPNSDPNKVNIRACLYSAIDSNFALPP